MRKKIDRLVAFELVYVALTCVAIGGLAIALSNTHYDDAITWVAAAAAFSCKSQLCNMRIRILNGRKPYE